MAAFTNPEFEFGGFNHLALTCSDMKRTVDFYTNILGMKLVKTLEFSHESGSGQHFFFDVGNGRDAIAFFWFEDAPPPAPGIVQSGRWLEGAPRRSAIGAMVTVTTDDGVAQVLEVGGGYGHYGAQNDLTLHFGLGAECVADVTVRWPDADLTEESATLNGLTRYTWTQGEAPVGDRDAEYKMVTLIECSRGFSLLSDQRILFPEQ